MDRELFAVSENRLRGIESRQCHGKSLTQGNGHLLFFVDERFGKTEHQVGIRAPVSAAADGFELFLHSFREGGKSHRQFGDLFDSCELVGRKGGAFRLFVSTV